jgi:tryptophan-rich sensory protein
MNGFNSPTRRRGSLLRWALVCIPAVLVLGRLSGAAAGSSDEDPWFAALAKPEIYPPAATFGIVWSILYILMGLALAIVGTERGAAWRKPALIAFAVQLALNLAWSPVFFAAHQITGALLILLALDVAVIATIALFWRVRPLAGLLLLPYLAWSLFATVLNWQFLQLNPSA